MSTPITVRLPDLTADGIRLIAHREHRSISEIGARFIDEGYRQYRFPYIKFRSFNGERHACLKGALQIWQLIMVAKDYAMDLAQVVAHLSLKPEQVQAGFNYYAAYQDEIDLAISQNDLGYDGLKTMLPGLTHGSIGMTPQTTNPS